MTVHEQHLHFRKISDLNWEIGVIDSCYNYGKFSHLHWDREDLLHYATKHAKRINTYLSNAVVNIKTDKSYYTTLYLTFKDEADEAEFLLKYSDGLDIQYTF